MTTLATFLAWTAAILVLVPALVLALETAASFLPRRRRIATAPRPSVAVIVPAHNEGVHIKATLHDLRGALRAGDRLIVVADNCADDTAAIARDCGAEILVRDEPARRGKGFALQFAVDHLRASPPDCAAFFDADCRVAPTALERLAGLAAQSGRPVQALYLMSPPDNASPRAAVAAFAWIMINRVRMTGLSNLADVTRFTGAGLVAPWKAIADLDFAAGGITEDLALSFEMIRCGRPPLLAPDAEVASVFPESGAASVTQRARWEHGSLGALLRRAPAGLVRGLFAGDLRAVLFALDALIPPLVLFAALLAAAAVFAALMIPNAGAGPFYAAALAFALYILSLGVAWLGYGRKVLPPAKLLGLGPFLLQKFKIYGQEGRASSKTWTRTGRDGPAGKE